MEKTSKSDKGKKMCNLNILVKKTKGLNNRHTTKVEGFMSTVTAISYVKNPHADGCFFSSGTLVKNTSKLNYANYRNDFKESNFVISHQRYTTSGTEDDSQPFWNGEFVFAHNGIISSFEKGKRSDTYNIFKCFTKRFSKISNKKTRQNRIYESAKCIFNDISSGSYSIAIYDTVDQAMYYFKNNMKPIHAWWSDNYLYMSTEKDNGNFLHMLSEDFAEVKFESDIFYKVTTDDQCIFIQELGEIGRKFKYVAPLPMIPYKAPVNKTSKLGKGKFRNYMDVQALDYDADYETPIHERIIEFDTNGFCEECNTSTKLWDPALNGHMCEDCIEEYSKDEGIGLMDYVN